MAAIVIVDANPDLYVELSWLLEDAGHTVTLANYSPVVLSLLDSSPEPLIVLLGTSCGATGAPDPTCTGSDAAVNAAVILSAARAGQCARHCYIVTMDSTTPAIGQMTTQEQLVALWASAVAKRTVLAVALPAGLLALLQVVAETGGVTVGELTGEAAIAAPWRASALA